MTIINLEIRKGNEKVHLDLERILSEHSGQYLHFELRYSGGMIVDLVVRTFKSYDDITKYTKQS